MEHVQLIKLFAQLSLLGVHGLILSSVLSWASKINTCQEEVVAWILLYILAAVIIIVDTLSCTRSYPIMIFYGSVSLIGFSLKQYLKTNRKRLAEP